MLKKILYTSILIGAIALSGCANEEADSKEAAVESSTKKSEANIRNIEEATAIPLNLTQEQKEQYYQKYVAVIENINAVNDTELQLNPITAFLDEHWIEVKDFEKLAQERADASIVVLENKERYHPASVPKTVTLKMGSEKANIRFEGSFDTKHTFNIPGGGQLFSVYNGISSAAVDSHGNWNQFGNVALLKDDGATYLVEVSGNYSQNGIISTHTISLAFDCDKTGGIS